MTRRPIPATEGIPAAALLDLAEWLRTVDLPACRDEILAGLLRRRAPAPVLQTLSVAPRHHAFTSVDEVLVEVVRRWDA